MGRLLRSSLLVRVVSAMALGASIAVPAWPTAAAHAGTASSGADASRLTFSWDLKPTGSDVELRGLAAVSRTVAWASGCVGDIGLSCPGPGIVLRTVDGGRSWRDVSPPNTATLRFRDIEAFDRDNAVVLAVGGEPEIYLTRDGGASWTHVIPDTDDEVFYDCMTFSDRRRGLALSDPVDGKFRLVSTTDGGLHWQLVPTTGMPAALPEEAAFAAAGTCMVSLGRDVWFGTGGGQARVFHSQDGGTTWSVATTPVRSPANGGIVSLAFRDRRQGLAVGGDVTAPDVAVGAARTADGGRSWTLAGSDAPAGLRTGSAWVPWLRRTALAVGPTGSDVSTDGGRTWRLFDTRGFYNVDCARDGACWASGELGTVARLRVSHR